jgi:uncharacterized protein (DUF58 family)
MRRRLAWVFVALTVMLVVDVSASGDFGSRSRMKGEVAVEICAVLAFSAITNNDKVGLIIFSDRIEKFVPPRKGRRHVLRVLRELLYFRPEGRGTDVAGALEYLARVVRRRAVVFVVSDFLGDGYEKALAVAERLGSASQRVVLGADTIVVLDDWPASSTSLSMVA